MFSKKMTEPHICMVAPQIFPVLSADGSMKVIGGAEVQQNFIARGLYAAGYPVSILTGDFGQPDEIELDGLRIFKIKTQGRTIPIVRYFHPRLTGLWSAMDRADADIYYQRCAGAPTFVTGLYAKIHRKRFVFAAAHDLDLNLPRTSELFQGRGGRRDLLLYRTGLKMADEVIAQHLHQVEAYRYWYRRNATCIPNGYKPPANARCEPKGVVLWVSVMRRWKRPELFLRLARLFPNINFRMIGGVSLASGENAAQGFFSEIEASARALSNVEFLGFLPYKEVERHFNEARLLVNTSDYEGFPNTFLQAWARGIPTLSFVNCGARDLDGPIGIIAHDLKKMQAGILRLTTDMAFWSNESERCKRYFHLYHSMPAVIARYRALFDHMKMSA